MYYNNFCTSAEKRFLFPKLVSSSFYVSYLSTNWPAPNVWFFMAQLVEHCSANAEAMGSNTVEVAKMFSG